MDFETQQLHILFFSSSTFFVMELFHIYYKGDFIMDYFSAFIQMLHAKKLSQNTIRVYVSYIKTYLAYLDRIQLLPEQASYQNMWDYLDWLQSERSLSDRTINMVISYLQFFQMYVLHKDWDTTQLPFRAFDTYLPYAPSPVEVKRFLRALDKPKARLAVSMLYATGLRLDELCHLRCSDIMHSSMKIYIRHSKNHSDRYIPLTESIWQMILQYWYSFPQGERPREWLFTQQRRLDRPMDKQWLQREVLLARNALGLDCRLSAHSFRHAYATRCYENGLDLLTLKAYLGHSSINSTCIYVRLAASYKNGFVNPFDQLEGGDDHA